MRISVLLFVLAMVSGCGSHLDSFQINEKVASGQIHIGMTTAQLKQEVGDEKMCSSTRTRIRPEGIYILCEYEPASSWGPRLLLTISNDRVISIEPVVYADRSA